MDFFKNYFDDCLELLLDVCREESLVSEGEIFLLTTHISLQSNEQLVETFIDRCFPHLDELFTRKTPMSAIGFLKDRGFEDAYTSLDEDSRSDLWDSIHGMVKSSIMHAHSKNLQTGHDLRKLSKTWGVRLV